MVYFVIARLRKGFVQVVTSNFLTKDFIQFTHIKFHLLIIQFQINKLLPHICLSFNLIYMEKLL